MGMLLKVPTSKTRGLFSLTKLISLQGSTANLASKIFHVDYDQHSIKDCFTLYKDLNNLYNELYFHSTLVKINL